MFFKDVVIFWACCGRVLGSSGNIALAVIDCAFVLAPRSLSGFVMIIGLGADFWSCPCWVGVLSLGLFPLWISGECDSYVLPIFLAYSAAEILE